MFRVASQYICTYTRATTKEQVCVREGGGDAGNEQARTDLDARQLLAM